MARSARWTFALSLTTAWAMSLGPAEAQTVTTRVSVDATGTQVAGASRSPSASADGRFVAFSSTATTLVAGDGNGSADVFVKDRQTGAVTRVSVRTGGAETAGDSTVPDISADGRYVTFVSAAALVADDTNAAPDIYRHDRVTAATVRVSVSGSGVQADGGSAAPRISGDGHLVVFESLATNLVTGDTNQRRDIFLRDLTNATTTRLSVATNAAQSDRDATSPSISDDGTRVLFLSDATTLDPAADPLPCDPAVMTCMRAFLRSVGTTSRVGLGIDYGITDAVTENTRVAHAVISGDGLSAAVVLYGVVTTGTSTFNLESVGPASLAPGAPATSVVPGGGIVQAPRISDIALGTTSRFIAVCAPGGTAFVYDWLTLASNGSSATVPDCDGLSLAADGLTTFVATSGTAGVASDTNGTFDVFAVDFDGDDDGMSVSWENTFHLNDATPADALLDPDGDGVSNRDEFLAGTHPQGQYKYYLAEGAENAFFKTEIAVFKTSTGPTQTSIVAQVLGQNGRRTSSPILNLYDRSTGGALMLLAPRALGFQIFPLPDQAFSTVIESNQPLAVERTMTWGGGMGAGYGSHAERAITGPAATWYFAEGATHGSFDLFYLLQNPGATTATATITYLLPAPRAPIVRSYSLLPNSRRTIYVDQEPGLEATDVSSRIDADHPIFAERAMYLSTAGQPFAGGTASAGITAPATQWFIAEGATGAFFDLYILIGNPSVGTANVTVTYLLPDGSTVDKSYQVAGQSRRTIVVKSEDPRLAATAVSATITSTNATPIVVERAMWWPTPAYYEGTVTAATTTSTARWALAGGFIDNRPETETYLLIANPGSTAANVTIDVGSGGNQAPNQLACKVTVPVPARGRYTTGVKALCPALSSEILPFPVRVAGTIESDGPPIVVERSTYWSAGGQFWAAGASTLLTPLP